MVEIKLISFLNNIARLECYPNGDKERSFILTVDAINKKIIDCSIDTQYNSFLMQHGKYIMSTKTQELFHRQQYLFGVNN